MIVRISPVKTFYHNSRHLFRSSGRFVLLLCLILSATIFTLFNPNIFKQETVESYVELRYHSQDRAWKFEMHKVCNCPRAERALLVPLTLDGGYLESSCSDHATARGSGQMVISYSFYGTVTNRYFNGTEYNVKAVKQMYPGWIMRLYHNISMENDEERKVLCKLWCENDNFDVCDVHHLPSTMGDQSATFGMLWRFFTLGDPLVDIFLARDLDSAIIQREVDAVHHWLNDKNKATWHIMRDNIRHNTPILGGMWGGMNGNISMTTALRKQFITQGQHWKKGYDQKLLRKILWPFVKYDMVSHDSYLCKKYYGTQPFPTKRNGSEFVGDAFPWPPHNRTALPCPIECRPKTHQDWIYC